MNITEIENLLEKYFEGDTTLSEEKTLREFFSQGEIPPHLSSCAPMFRFFSVEANVRLSEERQYSSLERRLEQYRNEAGKTVPVYRKRKMYYFSGIAAGLLLLVGLVFVIRNEIKHKGPVPGNAETEIAYNQTCQALMMVSLGLNTGLDAMQRMSTIDNAVERIQLMNKFFDYKNQFINPDEMLNPSTNQTEK